MKRIQLLNSSAPSIRVVRYSVLWVVGIILSVGMFACSDDDPTEPPPPEEEEAFFPADFKDTYQLVRTCRFSSAHDGEFISVYADPGSSEAYLRGDNPLPQGSVLVKALHSTDTCDKGDESSYVAMLKGTEGTNAAAGDWIWQDVAGDLEVLEQGSIASCIGCHSECETTDYACTEEPLEPYSVIETWMGTGISGQGIDGPILSVDLSLVQDLTYGPAGRMYVLDWNNHRVRVVDNEMSQTLIGTGELGDALDGPASEIKLNHPTHVSFDPFDGNLVMSAWHNSKVMKMDFTTGLIASICGNGQRDLGGDGGPAIDAILDLPSCSVFDPSGNLWISDLANQCVRMIDTNGVINTVVGKDHEAGFSGDGGPAVDAKIWLPIGQAAPPVGRACFDKEGNYYLADTVNNRIRMVDTGGTIHTVAGSNRGWDGDGGPATEARMTYPSDVAISPDGDLFIADTRNSVIRKVDMKTGIISTFAGIAGEAGYDGDGVHPTEAKLNRPYGIEFDREGNLYIADTHNHRIRIIRKNPR